MGAARRRSGGGRSPGARDRSASHVRARRGRLPRARPHRLAPPRRRPDGSRCGGRRRSARTRCWRSAAPATSSASSPSSPGASGRPPCRRSRPRRRLPSTAPISTGCAPGIPASTRCSCRCSRKRCAGWTSCSSRRTTSAPSAACLRRLLEVAAAYGAVAVGVTVPLTQEQLAALAGTSRATVNAVLSAERQRGTVSLGRGRTTINDPAALARRAGAAAPRG